MSEIFIAFGFGVLAGAGIFGFAWLRRVWRGELA